MGVWRNTNDNRTVEVSGNAETRLERLSNWKRVEGGELEQATGVYDPGQHTVPDVLAYLADADDDEQTRVLDAELAGQGRKGILDAG